MKSKQDKIAFTVSVGLHLLIVLFLVITFEKTLLVPANPDFDPNKPIIDAVMISEKPLKPLPLPPPAEEKKEEQKRLVEKEQKAKEKKEVEEKLALELEKKKEEEKAEAEYQAKKAKEKKIEEEKKEKERLAKLKEEDEKKKKLKKDKEEALVKKKAIEQKAKELIAKREKELLEKQSETQAESPNMRVKQDAVTRHAVLIRNKIHQNWRQPIGFDYDGLTCKLAVKLMPTGEVVEAVVVQSSGSLEFDRSAELAVRKASPLPMPIDAAVANEFRQFNFTFRPEAV